MAYQLKIDNANHCLIQSICGHWHSLFLEKWLRLFASDTKSDLENNEEGSLKKEDTFLKRFESGIVQVKFSLWNPHIINENLCWKFVYIEVLDYIFVILVPNFLFNADPMKLIRNWLAIVR